MWEHKQKEWEAGMIVEANKANVKSDWLHKRHGRRRKNINIIVMTLQNAV